MLAGAREWGLEAAERYHQLMLALLSALGASSALPGSRDVLKVGGVMAYPLRLGRSRVDPDQRVGSPRYIVVYRIGEDGVVEIIGVAYDRMSLTRAARRMRRETGD